MELRTAHVPSLAQAANGASPRIRVGIVEDHHAVAEMLQSALELQGGFEVVRGPPMARRGYSSSNEPAHRF